MSNEVFVPEAPSYLAAIIAANPELANINQDALAGSSKPMPPTIVANKGKFVMKVDKVETTIVFPDNPQTQAAGVVGAPVPQLSGVFLKAKPGKEKAWYADKYTPGQDTQAPDCSSDDGITPNPDVRLKQCDNCASCPQNVFGSGTDAQGNPTNGKACADRKVLAMFANGGAYRFAIPPASLGNWDKYCNQLTTKRLPLPAVITKISFAQGDDDYKLEFTFSGLLAQEQLAKLVPLLQSPEVQEIISPRTYQAALPAPTDHAAPAPSPDPAAATAAAAEASDKKHKADAEKKRKAEEKKAADAAAQAAAASSAADATVGIDLGLGADLGLGGAASAAATATAPSAPAGPSDADLVADLGL